MSASPDTEPACGFLAAWLRDSANSRASNRSKSDKDPSAWLPPFAGYRCQYATDWVADKTRYQLSIDPGEEAALSESLSRCPNESIQVTFAHSTASTSSNNSSRRAVRHS